ncbi:MAG: endonuclease V [Thermoplasmatales archaeon]|nr:MAG: endonuclease V [Thermoplasmatales archaeon]
MNLFKYTYDLVRQIPKGKISTYGAVAKALGNINASRAVGRMMNQNPDADDMPCYKIVHSDGRLGGFGLGIDDKIRRLKEDNIFVKDGEIVDFEYVLFDDFKTDYPLEKLRQEQIDLSKKVKIEDDFNKILTIAGFDVAYPKNEFDNACGACVIMDYKTGKVIEEKTVLAKTDFPYVSTYLFYREFPIVKKLMENLDSNPSVIMFDGNGILHPYRSGLASHAGLLLDRPSIGVAKSLLYGKVEDNTIKINNEKRGFALITKRAKKPIYISPGYRVSLKTCVSVVRQLCKYKIPEPLRLAHTLSKKSLINSR